MPKILNTNKAHEVLDKAGYIDSEYGFKDVLYYGKLWQFAMAFLWPLMIWREINNPLREEMAEFSKENPNV